MLINIKSSPGEALNSIHDMLKRAGVDKNHNFRFFSAATTGSENKPESRMVVLRSFSENWEFEFYTDYRSDKVTQIRSNPVLQALFWDPSKRVQVRVTAEAAVHHKDELAKVRWNRVQGDAQKAYTQLIPPGTEIKHPGNAHQWPETMDDEHFAVVRSVPMRIKILQLSGMEHLALVFHRTKANNEWSGSWIAP